MIKINREKAEASILERLRVDREKRLAVLDVEYMRALEAGLPTDDIAQQKQALRDITTADLSGLTLDELAALDIPAALVLLGRV